MKGFRGIFFGKSTEDPPKQAIVTPESELEEHWKIVHNQTLIESPDSLRIISHHLAKILELLDKGIKNNSAGPILNIMRGHEIPKRLVEFAYGDRPRGLINEVIKFFTYFGRSPFCTLLQHSFIINPLNKILENDQAADPALFTRLVRTLLTHVAENPETLHLFYVSEESVPLIHHFSQLLVSEDPEIGAMLIQILVGSSKIEGLLNYIITYSPIISMIVDILNDAVANKKSSPRMCEFLEYVNMATMKAPTAFVTKLENAFAEVVTKPMVFDAETQDSLKNAIYILASFTAQPLISRIVEFEMQHIQANLQSSDEKIVILAIKLVSLMFEKFTVKLPEAPVSVKIAPEFMGLIHEWYVRDNINQELHEAWSRVSMSMSDIPKEEFVFDLTPLLPILVKIADEFVDNPVRINLAISEFFVTFASTWGNEPTFFALSQECDSGLFNTIKQVAVVFKRRVGKKPGTVEEIQRAYKTITEGLNPEQKLYHNLIVFLEFLKQLDAIAKSKNMLHQRNSIIIE